MYQLVWFREFRLVFGGNTPAAAAVLAVFIGGLGAGGALLGPRADRDPRPLRLYAHLEALVGLSAAVSPGLLWMVRELYVGLGGSTTLGTVGGTLLRLGLGALVLAGPTVLMGGTLPAAVRAIESERDRYRARAGLLYGVNTLGAVLGALAATFWLLPGYGNRRTLWMAVALNLLLAGAARLLARGEGARPDDPPARGALGRVDERHEAAAAEPVPEWFAFGAAAAVGFAFFLMELVWYRMLGALFGATVFTFGLILALALFGIGVGGALYALWGRFVPATLTVFALTCLMESIGMGWPFFAGDALAIMTIRTTPALDQPFWLLVRSWAGIGALCILPAAVVAGFQFPLLIALLGRGRARVGRQTGFAYAWNTGGAILGSLAGGFGLMPLLSAPGCWRAVTVLLALFGLAAAVLATRRDGYWLRLPPLATLALGAVFLVSATGPTAAWRHSGISGYRVGKESIATTNDARDFVLTHRRVVRHEWEGREASVGVNGSTAHAFFVNGRADGNVRTDAGTQVMGPLVGAVLHGGRLRRGLVIGLGSGSSAGWLGAVPEIEQVDVYEIEPAILEFASLCASANRDVLRNPKVRVHLGDARALLMTSRARYDLVFSEPSNPSRAGIANLFTREYYEVVADHLVPDGLFLQWVQAYEVSPQTVSTIYATLAAVFPNVETWELGAADLLMVASRDPIAHDSTRLRRRITEEPFRSALANAWRVDTLEGVLAHHLARPTFAARIAAREAGRVNTDDHNVVEFGFSRLAGAPVDVSAQEILAAARSFGEHRPEMTGPSVSWAQVDEERRIFETQRWTPADGEAAAGGLWQKSLLAESFASTGDDRARPHIEELRRYAPVEADGLMGRLLFEQGDVRAAADWMERSLVGYRRDPWPDPSVMARTLGVLPLIAARDGVIGRRLFDLLGTPFALDCLDEWRRYTALRIANVLPLAEVCLAAIRMYEPNVLWTRDFLDYRKVCLEATHDPRARMASADLAEFDRNERDDAQKRLQR